VRERLDPALDASNARRQVFLDQGAATGTRSPLYAELCRRFADDPLVDPIVGPEPAWDAPLRLLGGLHALVLSGRASWDDVDAALEEHAAFLAQAVAERRVQTNEVQRCWVLLPCFLELARRSGYSKLDLVELGPSAGLNLMWDRYRYVYGAGEWSGVGAALELRGEERRPVPADLLRQRPVIGRRIGIDLSPVDVTTDEGALLLKSFVWADQRDRLELLDRAITALREDPPELVAGSIAEELPGVLARRREGSLTVVWQTAVLGYVSDEHRERVYAALAAAGADGPLGWISAGRSERHALDEWGLRIRLWPDGKESLVGYSDYHGAWLEWAA
jgi:hypothetical protein